MRFIPCLSAVNRSSVVIAALLLSVAMPCGAQKQTAKPVAKKPVYQSKPLNAGIMEMRSYFKAFKKPAQLPIPDAAGSKFNSGLLRTNNGVTTVTERFGSPSSGAQLLNAYKSAFLQEKWKIGQATTSAVSASYKGQDMFVTLSPRTDPKMATDFQVIYSYKSQ